MSKTSLDVASTNTVCSRFPFVDVLDTVSDVTCVQYLLCNIWIR